MNTFGRNLRITTFGESHGPVIGAVIDGFPSNFKIDFNHINEELSARTPGNSILVSQRKEPDIPEFLSGISENGITLGSPIAFLIKNKDQKSGDYVSLEHNYRPNHSDFTYDMRYGIRDHRGGGRSSARETANWTVCGALAQQFLTGFGLTITSILSAAGQTSYVKELNRRLIQNLPIEKFTVPTMITKKMEEEILKAKNTGDSIGGIVTCRIDGLKRGVGNPIFEKIQSKLAQAMMTINAAKGFEYGGGFNISSLKGSESLDHFKIIDDDVVTETNFSGGIQGGISNGMPIFFNVAFKPTPSIMMEVQTISDQFEETLLNMKGRHDPCVAVRAVPVVKAMAALVIADFLI